ncbi:MAG: phage tail protein [Oscillospiraceae bacterium]|nr:phage tail protein [Oscillospiraceae bacterium]
MNSFTLDNSINSRTDLGLRITQPPVIPMSNRLVDSIAVDGREGSLTILRGWEDVKFNMKAALLGGNQHRRFREILPMILTTKTVSFSDDPDVYYNVKHVQAGTLERRMYSLYEFSLTFVCSPFRYIQNTMPVTMTSSGTVTNIGTVYSLPKIVVFGTGSRTLTINGKPIILNILSGSLTLDSELKTCYFGNVAQNQNMQGDFPVFEVGSNNIVLGSGISKIEVEGRWRHI